MMWRVVDWTGRVAVGFVGFAVSALAVTLGVLAVLGVGVGVVSSLYGMIEAEPVLGVLGAFVAGYVTSRQLAKPGVVVRRYAP